MSGDHQNSFNLGSPNLSNGLQVRQIIAASTINSTSALTSNISTTSVLNNGLASSPVVLATTSSPVVAPTQQSQPEQIIVPVGNVINSAKSEASSSRVSASQPNVSPSAGSESRGALDRTRLRELVKEVDPLEQMDDEVEEILLQVADDFIESVVAASCQLAKHRRSNTLEAKDVQLYLERSWNMQIPGFGSEEIRPYKRSLTTEAHKQRMALIRKTLKKY